MIRFKGDVYIAPEQIISIEPGDNGYSQINTVSGVCFVTESPEEVARKVLEWWFNMNWLKQGGGVYARAELERLTGLKEEPNHDT